MVIGIILDVVEQKGCFQDNTKKYPLEIQHLKFENNRLGLKTKNEYIKQSSARLLSVCI